MLEFKQDGINLTIIFNNKEQIETKLLLRIFRRFSSVIIPPILKLLEFDPKFTEYYESQLYNILKFKKEPSTEFIQSIQDLVSRWYDEVGSKQSYKLTDKDKGELTQEHVDIIFKCAYSLKLAAPILYTNSLTATQTKNLAITLLSPLRESQIDAFIYKFIQLKFSKQNSTSFWGWLSNNKFQNIVFHILNLYYIALSLMIVQLVATYNPIAFLKTVVEKSIRWIITDVYTSEVKYSESEFKKIQYVKDYSLIHSLSVKATLEQLGEVVRVYSHVDPNLLLNYNFANTYKYIALPLLTKLFKTRYVYFYNYKNWGVCSFFTALLLRKFSPSLTLLPEMCESYESGYKKVVVRNLQNLQELYDYPSPYQRVFQQKKIFDIVIRDLISTTYTSVAKSMEVKTSIPKLVSEYVIFYKTLILSNQYDMLFESVRKMNVLDMLETSDFFDAIATKSKRR